VSPPAGRSVLLENLAGVVDIMLGRSRGLARIDLSPSGILWSFWGLALSGLMDLSVLSLRYNQMSVPTPPDIGKIHYMFGYTIVALIAYAASLVALYLLCRAPAEQSRIPVVIAVHNWAAPLVSMAFVPLYLISLAFDGPITTAAGRNQTATVLDFISILWLGVLVVIAWRLFRISMDAQKGRTIALFVLTAAVSFITAQGLHPLFGLS